MARTLFCSLAGAGVGFVAGVLGIAVVAATMSEHGDTVAASFFTGVFLAGAGAIAGAVIGGVADLQAYFRSKGGA
jgi:hypothetical protein